MGKLKLTNLWIVLVSLLAGFLIAEGVYRILYAGFAPVDQLFGKPAAVMQKPYVMYGGRPGYGKLNEYGYKDAAPAVPKPEMEFRVFVLGGSAVFNGNPTICKLLEQEFNKQGYQNLRAYNYALPASTSGEELARIVYEIADHKPDLILMYNGGNDLMIRDWADPRPGYPFNYFVSENNPLLEPDVGAYPMWNLILYESKLLRRLIPGYFIKVFTTHDELQAEAVANKTEWKEAILDTYLRNISKAQKISKGFGADFIACFQPLAYFKNPRTPTEDEMLGEGSQDMEQRYQALFKKAADKGVALQDLNGIFQNYPQQAFADNVHTLQQTKPYIASKLYELLVTRVDSLMQIQLD